MWVKVQPGMWGHEFQTQLRKTTERNGRLQFRTRNKIMCELRIETLLSPCSWDCLLVLDCVLSFDLISPYGLKPIVNGCVDGIHHHLRLPADNRPLLLRRSSAPGEITELPHHQNILRKLRFHTVLKRPKAFQGVERRGLPWERDDEVVDAQLSGGAVRADVGGHIGEEGAVESGDSPVSPFHRSPAGENDPRFVHLRVAQRRDGFRELVVVGPQNRADAVPAGVAQRSQPVQIWLHADVVLQSIRAKHIRKHAVHLHISRMMHPRSSIHELNPTGRTRRQNLVQLRHVQRHRLLQQHVLLLLRRQDGPPHVEAGGERDVNGVHVRVVQHGVVAAVNFRGGGALGLCDKRRRLLRRAAAHGGDCRVWSQRYSPGQIAPHGGTAQYSETDLPLLSHFSRPLRSTLYLYMQPLKGNIYKGKKGTVWGTLSIPISTRLALYMLKAKLTSEPF
nr:hypothetical protein CR513_00322 [Ipomoea batatas]